MAGENATKQELPFTKPGKVFLVAPCTNSRPLNERDFQNISLSAPHPSHALACSACTEATALATPTDQKLIKSNFSSQFRIMKARGAMHYAGIQKVTN